MNESNHCQRGRFLGRVTRRRMPCREHFELTIRVDAFPDALPGQFVQLLCAPPVHADTGTSSHATQSSFNHVEDAGILLRRPFSIGGMRRKGRHCEIDILGRVVGRGTAWLDARMPGDEIDMIGPLGRPFPLPDPDTRALLIAGGVGLPPIQWLGESLALRGVRTQAIFGAQTKDLIPLTLTKSPAIKADFTSCAAEFTSHGIGTIITTDDGTCGIRGRVTDAMREVLDHRQGATTHVFACGPEPMLESVAKEAAARSLPCQLALERVMACGVGTCQSCVVRISDIGAVEGWRYALCCTEGPVFDAARVTWSD